MPASAKRGENPCTIDAESGDEFYASHAAMWAATLTGLTQTQWTWSESRNGSETAQKANAKAKEGGEEKPRKSSSTQAEVGKKGRAKEGRLMHTRVTFVGSTKTLA